MQNFKYKWDRPQYVVCGSATNIFKVKRLLKYFPIMINMFVIEFLRNNIYIRGEFNAHKFDEASS